MVVKKIDPKQVIREAFARTNRISQFIERLDGEGDKEGTYSKSHF
ncbi:hypothetical protein ACUC2M_14705 [Bacillus cytotoxicus]